MNLRKPFLLATALQAIPLGLLAMAFSANADEAALSFKPGETLTYSLRWKFIHAGSAVFSVQPVTQVDGMPACHFVLTVRSSPFLDVFYKVRDRIEAYTDLDVTRSLLYKNEQREGNYSRDVTVTFDWGNETARFENRGEKKDPIFVYPGTLDPLSITYYLRLQELAPGKVLTAPVTDGKRVVIGRLRVIDRQAVKVPAGEFETFLVEPEIKHLGGVFKRSETASVQIWLTSDRRHIPVKVSGKSGVGNFSAVLVSVESGSMATSMSDRP